MTATFSDVRLLLERYYAALLTAGANDRAEHLLHEVRGRLRQLQWTRGRLLTLEADLVAERCRENPTDANATVLLIFTDVGRPDKGDLHRSLIGPRPADELQVLLESFYYSANRIRDIFRDNPEDLPGLGSFECVGVRNVRNHLVEHPTRKSGVIVPSLKCGGPVGPQLKPIRFSLHPEGTADGGFHKNCSEFLGNAERVLRASPLLEVV